MPKFSRLYADFQAGADVFTLRELCELYKGNWPKDRSPEFSPNKPMLDRRSGPSRLAGIIADALNSVQHGGYPGPSNLFLN